VTESNWWIRCSVYDIYTIGRQCWIFWKKCQKWHQCLIKVHQETVLKRHIEICVMIPYIYLGLHYACINVHTRFHCPENEPYLWHFFYHKLKIWGAHVITLRTEHQNFCIFANIVQSSNQKVLFRILINIMKTDKVSGRALAV